MRIRAASKDQTFTRSNLFSSSIYRLGLGFELVLHDEIKLFSTFSSTVCECLLLEIGIFHFTPLLRDDIKKITGKNSNPSKNF